MDQSTIDEFYNEGILETSNNSIIENGENGDSEDNIDTDWIQESERYHHISDNQERELMNTIGTYFIYINKHSYIEKILFEKMGLENNVESGFSYLTKETVLKIIQDKKIKTPNSKYKIIDILSYIIDIEPNKMQEFSNSDIFDSNLEKMFFKVLPIFNDVRIDKSIFIFHSINHLYFIFQEVDYSPSHRTTLKSILKQEDKPHLEDESKQEKPCNNNTKKVRIIDNPRELHKFSNKGRFTTKTIRV